MNNSKTQAELDYKLKKAMNDDCIEVNKQQEAYKKLLKIDPHQMF